MKDQIWEQIEESFKFIHEKLDGYSISEKVDKHGINNYINRCAVLAAGTGAITGAGGGFTLILGLPADLINTITQQFKVVLAVVYERTGNYKISFSEFMKVVGVSVGVEVAATGVKFLSQKIAQEIAKRLVARGFAKVVPIIGGAVGGGVNFYFIKSTGGALLKLGDDIFES